MTGSMGSLSLLKNDLTKSISYFGNSGFKNSDLHPALILDQRKKQRFRLLNQLETGVSIIQMAQKGVKNVQEDLGKIKLFLKDIQESKETDKYADSVIQHFLETQIENIQQEITFLTFHGTKILNGDMGVKGETSQSNLIFVKGTSYTKASSDLGFPLRLMETASRSSLLGDSPLTSENLKLEKMISIFEGVNVVHYKLAPEESSDSLIKNLQENIFDKGLDLSVFRTMDDHLLIMHNQTGSRFRFTGMSYRSCLLSETPCKIINCEPGRDIKGSIAGEDAFGYGNFLVGARGNKYTDGLILYYDGKLEFPGQIIGRVYVEQNGIEIPLSPGKEWRETLSFPSVMPENLAIGVSNSSGFLNLSQISSKTENQRSDTLRLINLALQDLELMCKRWKENEAYLVSKAIEYLKNSLVQKPILEEDLHLSKEKSVKMAKEIKEMLLLNPEIIA